MEFARATPRHTPKNEQELKKTILLPHIKFFTMVYARMYKFFELY